VALASPKSIKQAFAATGPLAGQPVAAGGPNAAMEFE
jgi:hypothetical protein